MDDRDLESFVEAAIDVGLQSPEEIAAFVSDWLTIAYSAVPAEALQAQVLAPFSRSVH